VRFTIGFKIFGVAVFLATVMIVAALLSESRVKQAQVRIDVLAEHLLDLSENASDLRSLALREALEFRGLITSEADEDLSAARRVQQLYEETFQKFALIASEMRGEIDAATAKLSTENRKVTLIDTRVRLESLVSAHQQLHQLVKRIVTLHSEGNEIAKIELKNIYDHWNEIELNSKEVENEGLVFENNYFDQNFVCDYSDKNTDQIIFSENDRFEKVKTWDEKLDGSFAQFCQEMSNDQIEEEFNLTEKIDYLVESKYSLPSGGNIMIGKTDALTAIDVNTGAAKRFDTNREAIHLIGRLIKLKNISGKVVVDPVASDQNTLKKLVGMLKNEFRDDLSITNVYGYTRGGLLELSRSRNDRCIDELKFTS